MPINLEDFKIKIEDRQSSSENINDNFARIDADIKMEPSNPTDIDINVNDCDSLMSKKNESLNDSIDIKNSTFVDTTKTTTKTNNKQQETLGLNEDHDLLGVAIDEYGTADIDKELLGHGTDTTLVSSNVKCSAESNRSKIVRNKNDSSLSSSSSTRPKLVKPISNIPSNGTLAPKLSENIIIIKSAASITEHQTIQEQSNVESVDDKTKSNSYDDHDSNTREQQQKRENGHVLCVTNLASKTRSSDLRALFNKHGKVISTKIIAKSRVESSSPPSSLSSSSLSRFIGYVNMDTQDDMLKCIQMLHKSELDGNRIVVERYLPENKNRSQSSNTNTTTSNTKDELKITINNDKAVEKKRNSSERQVLSRGPVSSRLGSASSTTSKTRNLSPVSSKRHHSPTLTRRSPKQPRRSSPPPRRRRSSRSHSLSRRRRIEQQEELSRKRERELKQKQLEKEEEEEEERRAKERRRREQEERERERQREREREREREKQKLRDLEEKHRREADKLAQERERLRLEREKLEREKLETERLKIYAERLETERLKRELENKRLEELRLKEEDDLRRKQQQQKRAPIMSTPALHQQAPASSARMPTNRHNDDYYINDNINTVSRYDDKRRDDRIRGSHNNQGNQQRYGDSNQISHKPNGQKSTRNGDNNKNNSNGQTQSSRNNDSRRRNSPKISSSDKHDSYRDRNNSQTDLSTNQTQPWLTQSITQPQQQQTTHWQPPVSPEKHLIMNYPTTTTINEIMFKPDRFIQVPPRTQQQLQLSSNMGILPPPSQSPLVSLPPPPPPPPTTYHYQFQTQPQKQQVPANHQARRY